MQVRGSGIPRFLNHFADFLGNVCVCLIQQYSCGCPHQGPGPTRDNDGADDAHDRVQPHPTEIPAGEQCSNGQNRCQRVRDDVDVGRFQVVVVAVRGMAMIMTVPVAQQQGTDNVDDQSGNRDECSGAELNFRWLQEAYDRLNANSQGDHAENQRRGEPTQVSDLSGTETVTLAGRVAFCVSVSGRRDAQCAGMGCHVKAIGQQRHRAGDVSGGDLANHHHNGQCHNPKRTPGIFLVR
ncbi:hypothetical protein D9M71_179200 [compost metagenome]